MFNSSALYTDASALVFPRDAHSVVVDHLGRPAQDKALHALDILLRPT